MCTPVCILLLQVFEYVDSAEEITRAQKAFMTIELDHGKHFVYDAFMEFKPLRTQLRQLLVLAQALTSTIDCYNTSMLSLTRMILMEN